ncbi:MAG TPA: glycosyltransferase family 1 protein [Acidimicrobiales bacterium]|nr:glycosyltransferase family 1 protein [Acidimicrobiales bacterium]
MIKVALDGEPLLGRRTGVGNFTLGLLEGLAGLEELDVAVYAVTWRMRPELAGRLPSGTHLIGRPMPARPVRALWERRLAVPLEAFTGPLDVVHGTNFIVPPTWRAARVVTVHDLTPLHFPEMCQPETLAFPEFIRRAVRRGAWVHTHSRFVADEVIDAFGADPDRVRVVWSGIPPLAPAGPAGPRLPFERYILAVGTVEPRKDYPSLVRAFDALAGSRPDVGLVVIGADGWGAGEFREALERSPHRDRIVQLGYVGDQDLTAVLQGAALLAYPSRYEGFGYPPLQAMAAGVPVVATAAGSIPEVVGDSAVLVPAGDHDALGEAMAALLDDRDRTRTLGGAGRERAGTFSWDACARGMAAIYSEAASGTRRASRPGTRRGAARSAR